MNKLVLVFVSIITFCVLTANKGGRASDKGEGSTGAPGEPQACKNCHNGNIVVNLKMYMLDGMDTVKVYEPGKKYNIEVAIQHTGGPVPAGYGFQLTGLKAPLTKTGETIKEITALGTNVKTATALNNRFYAEHKGVSSKPIFTVEWTAPATGSGPVSFYSAGNGVNGNNNDSGDGSAKTSIQIDEKIKTSTYDLSDIRNDGLYPNPIQSDLTLENSILTQFTHFQFIDFNGNKILEGKCEPLIQCSELNSGVYFVKFINTFNKNLFIRKVIKI